MACSAMLRFDMSRNGVSVRGVWHVAACYKATSVSNRCETRKTCPDNSVTLEQKAQLDNEPSQGLLQVGIPKVSLHTFTTTLPITSLEESSKMVAYGRSPVSPPSVPSTNDTIADFGQTTTDGTLPQKRKKVLLLTNAERGQANVFLAVADALLHQTDQNPVVHFASFAPIEPAVHAITEQLAQRTCPPGGARILFHRLGGLSMKAAWDRPEVVGGNGHAGLKGWQLLLRVTLPWTGPEFLEVFDSVVNIIEEVQPDAVAVDPCLAPALTACHHLGVKFVVLSPNTIKDFAMPSQPNLAPLWKYPWLVISSFSLCRFTSTKIWYCPHSMSHANMCLPVLARASHTQFHYYWSLLTLYSSSIPSSWVPTAHTRMSFPGI